MYVDGWRISHAQHAVVVEVTLLNGTVLDADLAIQRCRQAKQDSAFHLLAHDVGVDHPARNRRHW